jgi:uncharacterized protein (DUF849 family)
VHEPESGGPVADLGLFNEVLRVGLEDNLRLSRTLRPTNAELVGKAMELAALLDRDPAHAGAAREALGLAQGVPK